MPTAIRLVSISFEIATRLDALEQQLELRAVDLARVRLGPVGDEAPGLQTFGPNAPAAAVEVQHPDLSATSVHEHVQVACGGVLGEGRASYRRQAIK